MIEDLIAFLRHLHVDASILPSAPTEDLGRSITRRTEDQVHPCIVCGERAHIAYVAHTSYGNRWLDLCHPHAGDIRKANELPPTERFGLDG